MFFSGCHPDVGLTSPSFVVETKGYSVLVLKGSLAELR